MAVVRITQVPVETSIQPTDGKSRVTQVAIETSISYDAPNPANFYIQTASPDFRRFRRGILPGQQQSSFFIAGAVVTTRRRPNVFVVS